MKNKQFEATAVVICLVIMTFILGLELMISENRIENNAIDNRLEE